MCGSVQLCGGLEAGIEGALHAVRKRAEEDEALVYEDWEVDDAIWRAKAEEGEIPPWEQEEDDALGAIVAEAASEESDLDGDDMDPVALILADAANGFNNLSRFAMLWTIRHRWPRAALFAFNCYRHEVRCYVRTPPGMESKVLLSKEGVIQGCVWGMLLYGITLVPLGERLKDEQPDVLAPFYADDFALMGKA